jgi:hypothetical protein
MNSINENACNPKIVKHYITSHCGICSWIATIKSGQEEYRAEIEGNMTCDNEVYYIGYLYSKRISKSYRNTFIRFGFSDYRHNYRYIMDAMLKIIKGDYSEVAGIGYCTATPIIKNNVKDELN